MKKNIFIPAFVLAFIVAMPNSATAQFNITVVNANEILKSEAIDDVLFTVQYDFSFIPDTLNPDKKTDETMMLKVGKKSSVFYSYARFLTDSIIEIDKKNGAGLDVIQNHARMYTPKVGYKIYKNYPADKITYIDQIATSRFLCQEKSAAPEWTITEDTMTIHSYPCRKAVCKLYGRTYEAWFAPEIARSEGPWKLQGLPGIILKAEDSDGHYKFECTGISRNRNEEDRIMYSADGSQPISRKELNKMYARFAADPLGYIKMTAPNVTVAMRNEDGTSSKGPLNSPFNPIERE